MLEKLKNEVCRANLALVRHGLVVLTWGNASAIDRPSGRVVIKPSGIDYESMRPEHMVVVDMDGRVLEGALNPSSDLATHLALYRAWPGIGGVVHTHAPSATRFAQAQRPIPCLGTTHADHFRGDIPVTRLLTKHETDHDYEAATGAVIVERFATLDSEAMPAVLTAQHGPFTWGPDVAAAVQNAVALEQVAAMAWGTLWLNPDVSPLPRHLLDKHFLRKHGPGAYYGQSDPHRPRPPEHTT